MDTVRILAIDAGNSFPRYHILPLFFWFETVNKFITLRLTDLKPEKAMTASQVEE
jgi:hypothetical protein